MADDRTQITVWVDDKKAEEWEKYWKEHPDFTSKSDLIRTCVTRQIHEGYILKSNVMRTGSGGGVPDDLADSINNIQEQLASMDSRLHSIEASSESTPEEIKDLALSLVDALPKLAEQGTPKTAYVAGGGTAITLRDSQFSTQIEALTDWANRQDIMGDGEKEWTEHDVRQALERAVNDFSRVEKTLTGTEPRYFEIDPVNPTEEPEGSDE
ncbi:hypothetical protein [Haloarchaeobius sp. TZWSO28]|uniref:hypothetical protein n=1 Tax=Haloarchaeobius sp. TZWSO28 TaxID=3446119 RepID=UPI003EBE66F1